MAKAATAIDLSADDRRELESWVRKPTAPQRQVQRARIVLASAAERSSKEIARELGLRSATVSKWRVRFAGQGMAGLADAPRPGKPPTYDLATERRILAQLDQPPPAGFATWNGRLVAQALGDVSTDQVWRVLRHHRIQLQRRRSWCLSTDPQFAEKAADIVALYLNPPENAVVVSVDEKPAIQALERAQGWLRLPNGKALRGVGFE
jgi:transposase